jgi:peroxiredoxin
MATHSATAGVGTRAPDLELPDGSGTRVRLSDLLATGTVVLVFLRGFA